MDVIKDEPNLEEGTKQAPPVNEEPLIGIKYEECGDAVTQQCMVVQKG
jgi:hypothetical protein